MCIYNEMPGAVRNHGRGCLCVGLAGRAGRRHKARQSWLPWGATSWILSDHGRLPLALTEAGRGRRRGETCIRGRSGPFTRFASRARWLKMSATSAWNTAPNIHMIRHEGAQSTLLSVVPALQNHRAFQYVYIIVTT
jgi:hypothetical protein